MHAIARLSTVLLLGALPGLFGQNSFTQVTTGEIVTDLNNSYGCAWGDFDGEGWIDLFVANGWGQPNDLYRNNGDATFTRITVGPVVTDGGDSVCGVWADYDNDGDLDLFITNFGPPTQDYFYRKNGDGTFTRVTEGDWVNDTGAGVGAAWEDYDSDGFVDLMVGNSMRQVDFLYRNNRDGTMGRVLSGPIPTSGRNSMGCAWGDYNNDGFLDLFVAAGGGESPNDPPEPNLLYRNNGNANAWLLVKLIGTVSNRSAIGAKVRARATIGDKEFWQLREISGGNGYCSQNDLRAHFGLGDAAQVDTLRIEWPSGMVQELKDVPVRQILTVTEPPRLVPQGAGGFKIHCWINQAFDVEASTDLGHWSNVATVTNTTGTLVFEDADAGQHASRYYRVVAK